MSGELEIPLSACRICFKEDETVVNRISRIHKEIVFKITQIQFIDGPTIPPNMCKDCLNRLLEANYFRELLIDANKTLITNVAKRKTKKEETTQKKIGKTEDVKLTFEEVHDKGTERNSFETENVPEASEEQEICVIVPDSDEMYKIDPCTNEDQMEESLQLLEHCCCMCTYVFSSEDELRYHCEVDHIIQPMSTDPDVNQCRFCCCQFGNMEDLLNHKTCENCFDCFATNEDLIEHVKKHEFDTVEFQAVEVARQLEQETIETVTVPPTFSKRGQKQKKTNEQHSKRRMDINTLQRVANIFPCCLCATIHASELDRSQHMADIHKISRSTQFDPKSMTCIYCNRQFERMDQYYSHFEIPIRKQNRCTKCGRNFLTAELLHQHDVNIHSTDTPSYNCQACNIQFSTANAYYSHNHRHHTSKPRYKCDICGEMLITPSKLKEHRNVHLNIKEFVCNVCNKSFIRKDNLRNHLRVHTGAKPYTCEFCHKNFGHYTDMKRHRFIHTGEYPFKCKDCGKGFVKQAALETHLKFHKGKPHANKSKYQEQCTMICEDPDEIDDVKVVLVENTNSENRQ